MKKYIGLFLFLSTFLTDFLQAQTARSGKDYAVFFYVTDFKDRQWADLPETKIETNAIATELRKNYGFQVEMIANPSRQKILDKIQSVNSRRYNKDDQVLFFFSTHGHYDERQDEGFLIPADGKYQDKYGDSWISYANLGRRITLNGAEHVLLALDACYSGAFGIRNKARPRAAPWEANTGMDCNEKTKRALQYNSRIYFSSGSKQQRTPARSLFASRWLEVLRKGEELGVLRSGDLRYYLNRIDFPVPEDGSFTNHQANGDFVFVHKNACVSNNRNQDNQHWDQYLNTSSKDLLIEHLNRYPGCSHYQKAIQLLSIDNRVNKSPRDNLVFVKGGTFQMGSEDGEEDEKAVHKVTVSDFYIGRCEVTFDEYDEYCIETGKEFPRDSGYGRNKRPVINVSWYDAIAYCNWKSEKQNLQLVYTINGKKINANWNANGYRLPTEAEWEFAARSRGKNEKWAGTNLEKKLASFGNYCDRDCIGSWKKKRHNDGYENTAPVGSFIENSLGLHDMSGNVHEWCWDWFSADYYEITKDSINPTGKDSGRYRVIRDGSWMDLPSDLYCTNRSFNGSGLKNNDLGFRLSRKGH